ncbi:MAG: hypothetical protein Fur0014_14730 [Rubrivivax sp.]
MRWWSCVCATQEPEVLRFSTSTIATPRSARRAPVSRVSQGSAKERQHAASGTAA